MDLKNIESGIPNFTYPDLNGITRRLNRFFFEFQMMKLGYPPNGHSLFQRFIYWKNALKIIQQHWIIGVGTGDVEQAIQEQYQLDSNGLNNHYQLRTHNQYLTLILTFGIFAWIFIPYLFYSLIKTSKRFSLIALIFTILLLLSFLSEDTLETQAGVTFAAFFSAWWLGAPLWTSEKWRPLSD
jgi:O-antigen ligase